MGNSSAGDVGSGGNGLEENRGRRERVSASALVFTFTHCFADRFDWRLHTALGGDSELFKFFGDKNLALIFSAGISVLLLIDSKREQKNEIPAAIQGALASGGVIILVTTAGSAFGGVLRETGIADTIGEVVPTGRSLFLIAIAYLVTALVRTAQGAATVAMITAGGIVAPIALSAELSYAAFYLALAIGCGSKPISWANDSGFWVIGRMSGITPLETFKSVRVMMILMSLPGLAVVLLGAKFLLLV